MPYVLIPLLSVLSNIKIIIQGKFSKSLAKNDFDVILFNAGMFFSLTLVIVLAFGVPHLSLETVLLGGLFGALSVIFQQLYSKAFQNGPVSATCVLVNCGMFIPILFCIIAYHEKVTLLKILGALGGLTAIVFLLHRSENHKAKNNWKYYAALVFLLNGLLSVLQKIHQHTDSANEKVGFIVIAYSTATVISLFMSLVYRSKGETTVIFPLSAKVVLYMLSIGVTLGLFQILMLYLAETVDALLLYPLQNITAVLFSTLSGIILSKDKISKYQSVGISIGVISVLCLTIQI